VAAAADEETQGEGVMSIVEVVQRFETKFARPVCSGCPEGRFEQQVEKWAIALAEQLAHETGSAWGVLQNSLTGAGLVERVGDGLRMHPWFVVDHPAGGKTLEYSEQLVSERRDAILPGVSWVIPTNHLRDGDRDRIAEILERLARIEQGQREHDIKEQVRLLAATGMLQRLLILTSYYGTAASMWEFSVLGRTFSVVMTKPQAKEDPRA
jgi:hypothetical protein